MRCPCQLLAQQTTPSEQETGTELETVLVTGTSLARSALDTPLAATSIDEDRLAKLTANSQADILNSVPTIKAEGGGGEVATNVFIKGLPSGGQYQFTPLEYDGIPVFSSFGLNSSAFDVYYRNDLGIERLEFVRGGVSNLFGPGSVAGLINYISKTGTDTPEQKVQLEFADEDRARGDFFMSGPLGADSNLYYALSGFYRYDEGPIKTGNDTEGFQLRGNLKREFEDGSGSITVYGQYIDDQVQFYLPLPARRHDARAHPRQRRRHGVLGADQPGRRHGLHNAGRPVQLIDRRRRRDQGRLARDRLREGARRWLGRQRQGEVRELRSQLRLLPRRRRRGQRARDAGGVHRQQERQPGPAGVRVARELDLHLRGHRRSAAGRAQCCSRIASSTATARRRTRPPS